MRAETTATEGDAVSKAHPATVDIALNAAIAATVVRLARKNTRIAVFDLPMPTTHTVVARRGFDHNGTATVSDGTERERDVC